MTAVEIVRRFNAPDGAAHTMTETVANGAVSEAAAHTRRELVDRFSVHGPRALQWLRRAEATAVVPKPALRDTVQLLAELAPAVELIEAATGRSTQSPLPVLR